MILKNSKYYFIKALIERLVINFFKWRYIDDKFSFCYGVFYKSDLIANVGMVSNKLNNRSKERVFLDIQAWYRQNLEV